MLKSQREQEIVNLLKLSGGFVTVKELCDKLYVSESSVRRDLNNLEKKGIVAKTYGGAELVKNFTNVISFDKRFHHNTDAKKLISKKAKTLIKDGDIIFLDQSTTSYYLAREIMDNSTLTVVTNNIEILGLLSSTQIKIISSGGIVSSDNRNCLLGEDAKYIFNKIYADIMFFSTKSLSHDGVISDCTREEVLVRNAMLKNSKKKVFLCDSEKFNTSSPYIQTTLNDIDYLIGENDKYKSFTINFNNLKIL